MLRNLSDRISLMLKQFPIVAIIGARQVGKTTLAKYLEPEWRYIDMQMPSDQELVLNDPEFFFKNNPRNVILDEAQIFPILFDVLRGVIDNNRKENGRFIITGSSSPDLLKHLSESLAGRIAILELGTLKANEIANLPQSSFYNWFKSPLSQIKQDISNLITTDKINSRYIDQAWFDGGYPDIILSNGVDAKQNWFEFYEKTYLYRDIAVLFPKISQHNFQRFVKMLAYLSGTIINKAELARDLEISQGSIHNYLAICEGTFLWHSLPSFEHNKYKSIVKMPKGYISDSGLFHYLTRITNLDILKQHPLVGRSFEGFVIGEILKGLQSQSIGSWQAYHYRTKHGAEIDLILEGNFGILPIEIKYGIKIDKRQLTTLTNFINGLELPLGLVINQAERIEWLSPKILQLPVGYI